MLAVSVNTCNSLQCVKMTDVSAADAGDKWNSADLVTSRACDRGHQVTILSAII